MEKFARKLNDHENTNRLREGKPIVKVNKRPVLHDVGNKAILPSKNSTHLKTTGLATIKQDAVLKTNVEGPKTKQNSLKERINRFEKKTVEEQPLKKNIIKKENVKVLQRQESLLIDVKSVVPQIKVESFSSRQLSGFIDVDSNESDPMLVSEYIKDIMTYLLDLEVKYQVKENFLSDGHSSNPKMRTVLINWLCDVHSNFKLLRETFHLSVNIVDRYLEANKNIGRDTLQLVGTAASLIATKYEEMYVPDLGDFVYICDDLFTKEQILKMECDILKRLNFSLGKPSSIHFLRRYNRIAKVSPQHHMLGKYLIELAVMEYKICHLKPSIIAAAACCLSISILNDAHTPAKVWTKILEHYSTYKYTDIKGTICELSSALIRAELSKFKAIRTKYSSSSLAKISLNPKLKGIFVKNLATQAVLLKK